MTYNSSEKCYNLLEQGPCNNGTQLVLALGETGEVIGDCKEPRNCEYYEVEIVDIENGTVCECPDGQVKIEGKCEVLFSQGSCNSGDILVPQIFSLDQEVEICPDKFLCTPHTDCESFQAAKKDVTE